MSDDLTRACLSVGNLAGEHERLRTVSAADEVSFIDIRDRAARLCQLADTEAVLKPAREIIILCERALARRNP